MRVAVFSTKPYDKQHLEKNSDHELAFFDPHLSRETLPLAQGFDAVCCFVNDTLDSTVIHDLKNQGVKLVAMRCAGFNNVDIAAAREVGMTVCRVPAYSPHAVAEHTVGLILTLNRKFHRAYNRMREHDYSLHGLLGFDLYGKTVGVVGTGKIGLTFARIMAGFGCNVIAYDSFHNEEFTRFGRYVELDDLWQQSDIISLHCPLTEDTHYIINRHALTRMKHGVMLINTSRGGLLDTRAVIAALKTGKMGYLGLDVYEEEADLFFEDYSDRIMPDDIFARLTTFPNVVVTGHQGFFTREAMNEIARITLDNITAFEKGSLSLENRVV